MKPALLSPRLWPSWLGLGLLRILIQLPFPLQLGIGRLLGRALHLMMGYRRIVARTNLKLCFPEWSPAETEKVYRRHMASLGLSLLEMAMAWWSPSSRLQGLYQLQGLEHLRAAQAEGRGVLLLSAHFTCLEIGGRFLNEHHPLSVTYREFKNPVFHQAMTEARQRIFQQALSRSDTRGFIRALKRGQVVWYAPDQDMGHDHSVFVPFFGIPAATLTTVSRIAQAGNAQVLFFQVRRDDEQQRYHLNISPPLSAFPHADRLEDAKLINELIEAAVRQAPDQYLWIHRRFKTRPAGQPRLYPVKPRKKRKGAGGLLGKMPSMDTAQFESLVKDAQVLSLDLHGPKVYRTTDGRIVKLFRDKRRLSLNSLFPYAARFRENANRLRELGFFTVAVQAVYQLEDASRRLVIYEDLAGHSLREVLSDTHARIQDYVVRLAEYVALLHAHGVYFRSLHLGNVMLLENGELGLIDVADMRIYSRSLNEAKRARNLIHLLRYRQDWPLFGPSGPSAFVAAYQAASHCTERCSQHINTQLARRLPDYAG